MCASWRGSGRPYIGQGGVGGKESRWSRGARNRHIIDLRQLPRSSLDEPTLINGEDGLSKAVGNRRRKETLTGGTHILSGLQWDRPAYLYDRWAPLSGESF